jgi:hypothetical protein
VLEAGSDMFFIQHSSSQAPSLGGSVLGLLNYRIQRRPSLWQTIASQVDRHLGRDLAGDCPLRVTTDDEKESEVRSFTLLCIIATNR